MGITQEWLECSITNLNTHIGKATNNETGIHIIITFFTPNYIIPLLLMQDT